MPKIDRQKAICDGCGKKLSGASETDICLSCGLYFCRPCRDKHLLDVHQGRFWFEEEQGTETGGVVASAEGCRESGAQGDGAGAARHEDDS